MDLEKMSLNELKVLAYDEGVKFEIARNNLQVINKRISTLQQENKEGKENV